MLIALEGLPCSYKTTILQSFEENKNIFTIPEFILEDTEINPETCVVNDIEKSKLAKLASQEHQGVVLMDRSYLSTLVYEYASSQRRGELRQLEYDKLLRNNELIIPDVIIYLELSPDKCITRAMGSKRYDRKYIWFSNTDESIKAYEGRLSQFEGKLIKVDANTDNTKKVINEVNAKLQHSLEVI